MLYFLHIPKTGGTTIRQALIRSTSVFKIPLHIDSTMKTFEERLKELKDEKVVVGHFTYGIHQFVNQPHEYATVLRHPAAYVFSSFDFTKLTIRCGQKHASAQYAQGSIRDYITNAPQAQNMFTRQLSGLGALYTGPVTEGDYDRAQENLNEFKYVGTTRRLGKFWQKLQTDYGFKSNIGHERKAKTYRVENLKKDDVDLILSLNKWDLKLYEYAKSVE